MNASIPGEPMRIFIFISLLSVFASAQYSSPVPKDIEGADIVCVNTKEDLQVSINTTLGKIWVKPASSKANKGVEAWGSVWTGIQSAERYEGEVMSELNIKNNRMYFSIVLRKTDSGAQMEAEMYSAEDGRDFRKVILDQCKLGL
jgi:hypothetical protein